MTQEKLITVKFTQAELFELDSMMANGVCDFEHPDNKVARSAYNKIGDAWSKSMRKVEKP